MDKNYLYQLLNSAYQVIDTFRTLEAAKEHINYIRSGFALSDPDATQNFIIIEFPIVYESGGK